MKRMITLAIGIQIILSNLLPGVLPMAYADEESSLKYQYSENPEQTTDEVLVDQANT